MNLKKKVWKKNQKKNRKLKLKLKNEKIEFPMKE